MTDIARTGAPDTAYAEADREFGETRLVALTMAIVAINSWNGLAISFRSPVGQYVAGSSAKLIATRPPSDAQA